MLYTVFDLETTGLVTSKDSPLQMAYLHLNDKFLPLSGGNLYFYKEGVFGAEHIHGLSKEFLRQYESDYEKNLIQAYSVLQLGNLVGYNSNSYDIPLASAWFQREGLPVLTPSTSLDVMQIWQAHNRKRLKLTTLMELLGIKPIVVQTLARGFFKHSGTNTQAHNAMYDTMATAMCLRKAKETGLLQDVSAPIPRINI